MTPLKTKEQSFNLNKYLKIIPKPNIRIRKAAPDKTRAVSFIKSILVIFMLSGLIGLSSCAVAVRTPHSQRHGILFINNFRSERPVYKKPHYKKEHHDNRKHRGHGKH